MRPFPFIRGPPPFSTLKCVPTPSAFVDTAPAPTWPLFVSVATYLVRTNSTQRSRKACANPPKSRQQLIAVAQQKTLIDKFAVENDALPEAVVKEVEIPVKKRELPGLLASLSQAETGSRTIPVSVWLPVLLVRL